MRYVQPNRVEFANTVSRRCAYDNVTYFFSIANVALMYKCNYITRPIKDQQLLSIHAAKFEQYVCLMQLLIAHR